MEGGMEEARRRALIAAVVGLLGAALGAAGAGHAYLREWRRAVAWFSVVLGVGLVLVSMYTDPANITWRSNLPLEVVLPLLVLSVLSALDAYAVASKQTTEGVKQTPGSQADTIGSGQAGEQVSCPHCGRDVDRELDFCHWCTEPLDRDPES
jgi:hypothetical protein